MNRIRQALAVFLSLAVLFVTVPMANAQSTQSAQSSSVAISFSITESISINTSTSSVVLTSQGGGSSYASATGVTVSGAWNLLAGHTNGVYLYSWVNTTTPFGQPATNFQITNPAGTYFCNYDIANEAPTAEQANINFDGPNSYCGPGIQEAGSGSVSVGGPVPAGPGSFSSLYAPIQELNTGSLAAQSYSGVTLTFEIVAW